MSGADFRRAGHRLVDALADFYDTLPERRVTSGETAAAIRAEIKPEPLPEQGQRAEALLAEIAPLLIEHSLHNGHPRFFGYITSSAAPLGALADLLAAAINVNCGLRNLSPAANEIEAQSVRWLAELIGFPTSCGGIMVSGGNVANILGLLAARRARLPWDVRRSGVASGETRPRVYASRATHTWIEKATDVAGLGNDAIRWIETDRDQRIDLAALEHAIAADRGHGDLPFLVIGTAGNVSTGAVDPLGDIAALAARANLWFHVDGAYGAPAACLPEAPEALKALRLADSVALDPHKWLFAPIEAACTLTRDADALHAAFHFRPPYYRLEDEAPDGGIDYYKHGLQNTRGFRALKVWLGLRQAGRAGYAREIRGNIDLAARLFRSAAAQAELEAGTQHLSITTFRYRPADAGDSDDWQSYLDTLNRELVVAIQQSGEAYVSNAILDGRYFLRACIVNFRTRAADVDALIEIACRLGRSIDQRLRRESAAPA
jgi:aromatic-L-amino-acid decarboxylase